MKVINTKESFVYTKWYAKSLNMNHNSPIYIRVFEDMQFKDIREESIREFFTKPFIIDSKSDKMALK